jgi:hypothetical protein
VVLSRNLLDALHFLNYIREGPENLQPGLNALWKSLVNFFRWNKSDHIEAAGITECRPVSREPIVRGRKHMTRYSETSMGNKRADPSTLVQLNNVPKAILVLQLFWTAMIVS